MQTFTVLVFLIALLVLLVWRENMRSKALLSRFKGQETFPVGRYVVGLEGSNGAINNTQCIITKDDFVFVTFRGSEIGRIPRTSVEEVLIDDKSRITQRLTVTRMITLGVFSLAAPKRSKVKEWCVAVRWIDAKRLNREAVFDFVGNTPEADANKAANLLMKYILRSGRDRAQQELTTAACNDTKLCPFCAETIKAAAVLCRFCNRDLPAPAPPAQLAAGSGLMPPSGET